MTFINGDTKPDRRSFLQSAALLGGTALATSGLGLPATAAAPIVRAHGAHMKLSLAAYSFRDSLSNRASAEDYAKAKMTMEGFIEYCAEMQLDGTELTAYYFPKVVTNEYLMGLKQLAFKLGLDISGTAIGNDFCVPEGPKREEELRMAREWIDYAAAMGAPVIRVFAGKVPEGDTEDAAIARCISAMDIALEYAAEKGVFLALENHGGVTETADKMLQIIKGVKDSPWFGVNFDSGNWYSSDPYAEMEKIAPYAVNAQVKVSVGSGDKRQPADLPRIVGILKDAGYRGYLVLEYEEPEDPRIGIPPVIEKLREIIHN